MEMSLETHEDLQRNFLIGNCKFRKFAGGLEFQAWHNDPALRKKLGLENNHYPGPIPQKDVVRRLFGWKPVSVPKANLIPCDKKDANWFMPKEIEDPETGEIVEIHVPVKISVTSEYEQGIIRSDNDQHIATHGADYRIHDYEEWLLKLQAKILNTKELNIFGAGLPRRGAQAYVQVGVPETMKDDKLGIEFLPYIMASTSVDGSLPTTFSAQSIDVVCDNTRNMALRQAESSGRIYKAKHTSRSLDNDRLNDVRAALRLIHQTAEGLVSEYRELAAINMNRTQVKKTWDIIVPIPDRDEVSGRAYTMANNRREALLDVYNDRGPTKGMMGNQQGTALGIVQAVNTWSTHVRTVHGNRYERNIEKTIRHKFDELDQATVKAIAQVMNRPELVSAQ